MFVIRELSKDKRSSLFRDEDFFPHGSTLAIGISMSCVLLLCVGKKHMGATTFRIMDKIAHPVVLHFSGIILSVIMPCVVLLGLIRLGGVKLSFITVCFILKSFEILNVVMLAVVMLNVIMQSSVMPPVVMLNGVLLNVALLNVI